MLKLVTKKKPQVYVKTKWRKLCKIFTKICKSTSYIIKMDTAIDVWGTLTCELGKIDFYMSYFQKAKE